MHRGALTSIDLTFKQKCDLWETVLVFASVLGQFVDVYIGTYKAVTISRYSKGLRKIYFSVMR